MNNNNNKNNNNNGWLHKRTVQRKEMVRDFPHSKTKNIRRARITITTIVTNIPRIA